MADELDLDKLEALEKAATPGPWGYDTYNTLLAGDVKEPKVIFTIPDHPDGESSYLPSEVHERSTWYNESSANIRLAESLRNAAPELLRRARRLERIERAARELGHQCGCPSLYGHSHCTCVLGALEER